MAIPDTYTFKATDVCAELQLTGCSGVGLSCMFADAPNISYCSTYEGVQSCLRNFRAYDLIKDYSLSASPNDIAADSEGNLWVSHLSTNAVSKITTGGTVSYYT